MKNEIRSSIDANGEEIPTFESERVRVWKIRVRVVAFDPEKGNGVWEKRGREKRELEKREMERCRCLGSSLLIWFYFQQKTGISFVRYL